MKKVDLSKLQVTMRLGSEPQEYDYSKELAQAIYSKTAQLSEHAFAMALYSNPVVELTEENKQIITRYTNENFLAFVQVAVNKLMEEV